jgi:hypothetical protein
MIQSPSRFIRRAALLGLLLSTVAHAEPGDRKRLGAPGALKNTVAGAALKNDFYSVAKNGALSVTDLKSGKTKKLGKATFAKTKFLMAAGSSLYALESDGSLYRVAPGSGAKTRLGKPGEWKDTINGAVASNQIYTVEKSGALYKTNPVNGQWAPLGKPEFGGTVLILGRDKVGYAETGVFTIEGDGSLYTINPSNGTWKNLGKPALWKSSKAGAIVGEADTIYVVNASGVLQWSILAAGDDVRPLPMGKPLYKNTKFLFVGHDGPMPGLYCLDADGTLYTVEMAPMVS